ncbi:glycoside hydrolase family 3 protein [Actinomyces lilanjuaniae]|uniref:beta-N-acetylhexosaminidase n=1 Tax=Actinomyces lilanjuaniae TaxID=2321394 RepID=A0ABN5PLN6_9ACTO|nr:glycoside hydrolase family 3 N-terminal domain-containing protein [Actinomyces lilanjuaniae]AYD89145.1 glycoside hydrolase family 3 protein [Actinomyces lilanjuaniae]
MVGQLVMVGTDADQLSPAATDAVSTHHVGSIFLAGRSQVGSQAVAETVAALTGSASTGTAGSTPMLVATDQEGGEVQVLSGPGFSAIPSARDQAGLTAEDLRSQALAWGQELAASGVTMNLAPVADLVDIASPASNEPIGRWGRGYGGDAGTVIAQAAAFAEGMRAAGVVPTCKHFPGLGRVTANTDTASGVTDTVTTRTQDEAVSVFAGLIDAGAEVVMMSSAVYTLLDDTAPAVFSPVVVTEMLRGDLGFTGVVITDDLSAAAQLQEWEPGQRAVQAVRAGCDLVLASADAAVAAPMAQALVAAAQSDPALAARVEESALRVLALKDSLPGA